VSVYIDRAPRAGVAVNAKRTHMTPAELDTLVAAFTPGEIESLLFVVAHIRTDTHVNVYTCSTGTILWHAADCAPLERRAIDIFARLNKGARYRLFQQARTARS
jgi:hypothetical protein